jgi:cytochrome P450
VPTPTNRRTARALEDMNQLMAELVASRRSLPPEELAARDDLLSVLVQATDEETGEGMTDKQLRDELLTLFFAGHETTSNALAWTFHLLSMHRDEEAKLRSLVHETLGDRPASIDDLAALAPVQHAIEESMRLYPPVCAVTRQAIEDVELGEWLVPAGSEVVCWMYWAQRDPRWWDEPRAFRPDRFAAGAPALRPGSYQPFGGGPRTCIGKHFALMEATLVLATVLQKVHLEAVPGPPIERRMAITMSPRGGLPFVPRAPD